MLLPPGTSYGLSLISEDKPYPLHAEECAFAERRAVAPWRIAEYRAGRFAARSALGCFGLGSAAIPRGVRGEPLWPAGIVGSISHCDDVAAAVAARLGHAAGLGIDIERLDAPPEAIAELVMAPDERAACPAGIAPAHWLMLHFSAKESVYKCISRLVDRVPEFLDVRIVCDRGTQSFVAEPRGAWLHGMAVERVRGCFAWTSAHVFTVAWLPGDGLRLTSDPYGPGDPIATPGSRPIKG